MARKAIYGFRVDARALFNLPYPIQSRCQLSYPPLALSDALVPLRASFFAGGRGRLISQQIEPE